ncbi:MAG TPA: quinone-dependent dihydroorotate dehydrogenase [Anaerolineae bacterium]|nr:quinone-dependent dihydroorotate dehydrogenase [Anaerolineae bacterium]
MYNALRPWLFKLDPEVIHTLTLNLIRWAGILPPAYALLRAIFEVNDPRLEVEAFGVKFRNPVGLAAGYDKSGVGVRGLSALGFGHIEVGTLTRQKQSGNARPRVHRVIEAQGVINSMGFPNNGVDGVRIRRGSAKVGINIGKSKDTPLAQAAEDYVELFKRVYREADYVAINISSPNTLNLRQLQAREYLEGLLKEVATVREGSLPRVPVLVKIAPDLTESEVDDILGAIELAGVDGIIATNTTIERAGVPARYRDLKGGLSGKPLRDRSTAMIRSISRKTDGKLPIIGVGGVMNPQDAIEKLEVGARLVQIYTGLVYAGPGLVKQINRALLHQLQSE